MSLESNRKRIARREEKIGKGDIERKERGGVKRQERERERAEQSNVRACRAENIFTY